MVAITKTEKYKDTLSYISLLHNDAFKLINQAMDLGGSVQCELDNLPPPSGFLPSCSEFLGVTHHVGSPSVLFAGPKTAPAFREN